VERLNERDGEASIMRRSWHTSGCCAVGGVAWGEIVFIEKVNIENNITEFDLARLVVQLIFCGLFCNYFWVLCNFP
jgi:hypothetical protein